jgi:hypothetical protein
MMVQIDFSAIKDVAVTDIFGFITFLGLGSVLLL